MAEAELVIETRGLTKVFNRFAAVEDLDLRVPRGALYGFRPQRCRKIHHHQDAFGLDGAHQWDNTFVQ